MHSHSPTNFFMLNNVKILLHLSFIEMRALAELLGAYGVKYFSRKMMSQITAQLDRLKVRNSGGKTV